jgi:hypothetical protein
VVRGLYAVQVHRLRTQFVKRDNILVLNMHAALALPSEVYRREIHVFLGIPRASETNKRMEASIPVMNAAKAPRTRQKEEMISCAVRDGLARVYAPWNHVLYALEPGFPPFPSAELVRCAKP